ncbi:MAG TPA: hypothetical protein VK845_15185 [Gemmatimonadales bacterium]|nr:hypothetical protein [Gemmatimonadales bacterium]
MLHHPINRGTALKRTVATAAVLALTTLPAMAQDPRRRTFDASTRAYVAGRLYATVQLYFAHWVEGDPTIVPLTASPSLAEHRTE